MTTSLLYFFRSAALFIARGVAAAAHRHHVLEVFISLDEALGLSDGSRTWRAKTIVVEADVPHKIKDAECCLVLMVESESAVGRRLRAVWLRGRHAAVIPDKLLAGFRREYRGLRRRDCGAGEAVSIGSRIIRALAGEIDAPPARVDPRIEQTRSLLDLPSERDISVRELSARVNLSAGRLTHLFSDRIGVSIRYYRLWRRMRDALGLIAADRNFTDAAHAAGFADAAHLSRTFRRMFGFRLIDIFKSAKTAVSFKP
jgi:AraC-like DNA-binding protein